MTRARLALAALAVAALLPAAPASADCNIVLYVVLGRCENVCTLLHDVIPPQGPCLA